MKPGKCPALFIVIKREGKCIISQILVFQQAARLFICRSVVGVFSPTTIEIKN